MYFSNALIIFWLYKNGFGFSSLIIYYLLTFLFALLGILFLSKKERSSKKSIFLGILCNAVMILLLVKIFSPAQLFISAIFSGLNVVYFWIPYNIMYFKYSSENKRGLNSGIYYLLTPIVGITLQPLSGLVAEKFGFYVMFAIGIVIHLIPILLIKYLPDFKWDLNVKKELTRFGFNWSTFFQGISSRINYSLITIFTLFFISTPFKFGSFLGYLALVAALASVINGYISDKIKDRKYFFYFFSSLAVLSFLPLAFAKNPYYWGLFAGISGLCMYLTNPFWLAFNLDYYKEVGVEKTMVLREIFLNAGYVFNLLVVFFVFYFTKSTKISLIVISALCCLMPIVSYFQGIYREKNVT